MTGGLDVLAISWNLGSLPLTREQGGLLLPEEAPEEVFQAVRPHKARLLWALEDGEEVPARGLLEDPRRLVLLLVPEGAEEGGASLVIYPEGEEPPRRYLVPPGNLTPFLLWSARHEPRPRRVWCGGVKGRWAVDVEVPLEAALEAPFLGHVLAGPEEGVEDYLRALREGTTGGKVRLWRPGEEVLTLGVEEALELAALPF